MHQKVFLVVVVAAMAVVTLADEVDLIRCYVCTGFDDSVKEDNITNNKNCPGDNFDESKVNTVESVVCQTMMYRGVSGGKSITKRNKVGAEQTEPSTRDITTHVDGYFCYTDLCNSKDPSAAPPSPSLNLALPLLTLLPVLLYRT